MADTIAEIDVHETMVAVAIADVEIAETWRFERRQIGTSRINSARWRTGSSAD